MQNNVDMTTGQVAERLGVDPSTVYRWYHQGLFPNAYKKNPLVQGSPIMIPEEDVKMIEQERRKERQPNDVQPNDD